MSGTQGRFGHLPRRWARATSSSGGSDATRAFWSLWALGVAAVISGDFYGWNFGLGRRRVRRPAGRHDRHHDHVLRPVLQHRGDVPGAAAHRRRVLVRPLGDGPVGRVHHRPRREHGVRDHAGGRRAARSAPACTTIMVDGLFDIVGEPFWNSTVLVGGRSTWSSSRSTSSGSRRRCASPSSSHRRAGDPRRASTSRRSRRASSASDLLIQHPDGGGEARRRRLVPAVRYRRHLQGDPVRDLVLPRDRGAPARGRGVARSEAGHPEGDDLGHDDARHHGRRRPAPQHGCRRRRAPLGDVRDAAVRRVHGDLRRGHGAVLLGLTGLIGLIASFFTIIYAYGRNTYSLSRAGYFPQWMSVTQRTRKTPHVALIAGGVVGYAAGLRSSTSTRHDEAGDDGAQVVAALLNMAVFGAVISLRDAVPVVHRCCARRCRTSSGRTGARWASPARRSPASSRGLAGVVCLLTRTTGPACTA